MEMIKQTMIKRTGWKDIRFSLAGDKITCEAYGRHSGDNYPSWGGLFSVVIERSAFTGRIHVREVSGRFGRFISHEDLLRVEAMLKIHPTI